MKSWKKLIAVGCILALMLPAFGCSDEGSAEKAGKKIDQAVEDVKDSAEKAFE